MEQRRLCLFFILCLILASLCDLQTISPKSEENEKMELRKGLDEITQELLTQKDPDYHVYHSYIFSSGVGNREELEVESLKEDSHFEAGDGVKSWQSVQCAGLIFMLGHGHKSVSLVVTSSMLPPNRTAHFFEHSIDLAANVSSTTIFTRWNPVLFQPEVIAVIAINSSSSDILWYRIKDFKLEKIMSWARYRETGSMKVVSVDRKNQLILVDTGSLATVDVFDAVFTANQSSLDFKLIRSFPLESACSSVLVCSVGRQIYLVFTLPYQQYVTVYRLRSAANMSHFEHYTTLSLPGVSQVIAFSLAHQEYLAVNGNNAYVFRITSDGDFIPELTTDFVSEWLAIPVASYRSDVVLFSRNASHTSMFVWAGANTGFRTALIPQCEDCLRGDWSGAVSIPFQHQNCLLLPRSGGTSTLINIKATLHENVNPVVEKLTSTLETMKHSEDAWQGIKLKMSQAEEMLKYVLKTNSTNVITAKWKLNKLITRELHLSSIMKPKSERNTTSEPSVLNNEAIDIDTLKNLVEKTVNSAIDLANAVELKEREVWGLEKFTGKITFNGPLEIDNLTVSLLNGHSVDEILQNSFRRDNPQDFQNNLVVDSLQAENLILNKVKNGSKDRLMFSDSPVLIKGNVTFLSPLTVKGDVNLAARGRVNGLDLSEELHQMETNCIDTEENSEGLTKTISEDPMLDTNHTWKTVFGGKNLTVMKVNGVDWNLLVSNVVYKDRFQRIPETTIVNGSLWSDSTIWMGCGKDDCVHPQKQRVPEKSPIFQMPRKIKGRPAFGIKIVDAVSIDPETDVVFSDLKVTGSVICADSEWGVSVSDVVLNNTNVIRINATKTFEDGIRVSNNLNVQGLVAGVNMSDMLTRDSLQVFSGPTTLFGNVTLGTVTLTGLWNGVNTSSLSDSSAGLSSAIRMEEVSPGKLRVLESLNSVPASQLVFTDSNNITTVRHVAAHSVSVTKDITVDGKFCNKKLNDFNKTRLSIKEEQYVSGKYTIEKANVTNELFAEKLNNIDVPSVIRNLEVAEYDDTIHLSELHVKGNITTNLGMNGFNLSDIAANSIWLQSNNDIKGHLTFKDKVNFYLLECQGFFNQKPCQDMLNEDDVVYKTNETIILSGKKIFINPLNISEDLSVEEINSHPVKNILTKTTEQEISGDLFISGDVVVFENATVLGLINNQNISELVSRCELSDKIVTCTGGAVFNDHVNVSDFTPQGNINGVDFNEFIKTLFDVEKPELIYGCKKFSGRGMVEKLKVKMVNNHNWDDFLFNAVTQNEHDEVLLPVVFKEEVAFDELSVDYNVNADRINGVDLNEWHRNAIYLNDSSRLKRPLHLRSASCKDDIEVITYDGVTINLDVVKWNSTDIIKSLKFESVNVTGMINILGTTNGYLLSSLEENTLQMSGNQLVTSDLVLMGDVLVSGNVKTTGYVNGDNLQDVFTLDTSQILQGSYKFECMEASHNMSTSGLISGVNMTEWQDAAVLKDTAQEVTGHWSVQGSIDLRGPVLGPGKLAGTDLNVLKQNITRDILDVYEEMKTNLSSACDKANYHLNEARNQTSKLMFLDVSQEIPVLADLSIITQFQSEGEDFLAVSEKICSITIFKWSKSNGTFFRLYNKVIGMAVGQLVALQQEQLTYIVTVSSKLLDCPYTGNHLWLFKGHELKQISAVDLGSVSELQVYQNRLYSRNSTGVYKWHLQFEEGTAFLKGQLKWAFDAAGKSSISKAVHMDLTLGDVLEMLALDSNIDWIKSELSNNCTGMINSIAVNPSHKLMAVATTENTEIPRYSDHVKVYHVDGRLFDKLPAQRASHLHWLPVPGQTWLAFLLNHSYIQLYHLQGILEGFELKLSAKMDATNFWTTSLPVISKVNLQPYIILHSGSSVKILQASLQGDPYLGKYMTCSVENALLLDYDNV